jgi:hypothetical protein
LSAPPRDSEQDGREYVEPIFHKLNTDRDGPLFQKINDYLRQDQQGVTQTSQLEGFQVARLRNLGVHCQSRGS